MSTLVQSIGALLGNQGSWEITSNNTVKGINIPREFIGTADIYNLTYYGG